MWMSPPSRLTGDAPPAAARAPAAPSSTTARAVEGRWEPPELPGDALEALIEEHRGRGIEPDGQTAGARWKSEEDIPSEVYFAASEPLL
jgi:hypothetical protein